MDAERLELLGQVAARLGHVALALVALLADQALDLLVLARVQRVEREVLELPLDRVDAEPVRQRRVDLERLLGLLDLLLLRQAAERAHVVQPVGQLDQDDPDVRGHRDHHLAVVLGLRLVARLERDPGELGDAVDEARDLLAELLADLVQARARVLDRVVQQRGAQRRGVEPHAGADLRHADRMGDEVLAGLAPLVGVVLAREHERLQDLAAVDRLGDLVGVLLDDREQVAEQLALEVGEVARQLERRRFGARRAVQRAADLDVAGHDHPVAVARQRRRRPARSGRSSCRLSAAQESKAVLEASLVGPEGGRPLERRADGRRHHREGRPLAPELHEMKLGEDSHQTPGERRRPRLRTVPPERRLTGLPVHRPRRADRAVEVGERGAQGVVPLMYSSGKA